MRYLNDVVAKDLRRKMVFVGGPRQCGKTTLSKALLKQSSGRYFNWDDPRDRRKILAHDWSAMLVFDELHKYPRWKNWIKGTYDTSDGAHNILVTGSARLDVYRRGGDSLLGRYHYWRLHPFAMDELPPKMSVGEGFERLLRTGGFPEPFLDGDDTFARRWRRERAERVLRDDVRDLEGVKEIGLLELLIDSLRQRVGGMIVAGNIATDLQVAATTISRWLQVLERMYYIFLVPPFTTGVPRAIQKPPKAYFFDNADVEGDDGVRFENFVATHLLKYCHYLQDSTGHRYELRYLRDKEGREVDFVIVKDRKVTELYECKWTDTTPSKALLYYAERLAPQRAVQVVAKAKERTRKGAFVIETPAFFLRNSIL
jgi:uncharacterized protein